MLPWKHCIYLLDEKFWGLPIPAVRTAPCSRLGLRFMKWDKVTEIKLAKLVGNWHWKIWGLSPSGRRPKCPPSGCGGSTAGGASAKRDVPKYHCSETIPAWFRSQSQKHCHWKTRGLARSKLNIDYRPYVHPALSLAISCWCLEQLNTSAFKLIGFGYVRISHKNRTVALVWKPPEINLSDTKCHYKENASVQNSQSPW